MFNSKLHRRLGEVECSIQVLHQKSLKVMQEYIPTVSADISIIYEQINILRSDLDNLRKEINGATASIYEFLNAVNCDLVLGKDGKPKLRLRGS